MSAKNLLIFAAKENLWKDFLKGYFSDTPAKIYAADDPHQAAVLFDKCLPGVVFIDSLFISKPLLSKIKVRKHTDPAFRVYQIGGPSLNDKELVWDGIFQTAPVLSEFNRHFTETLPMPASVRLLLVDDEEEIGDLVRDYFGSRRDPSFEIECAADGKQAFAAIARRKPDLIILDIKMPVMDGREFYTKLQAQNLRIPVIVFFDSISGEELSEIRKYGNPAAVEKGNPASALPFLLMLVKKLIYFRPET